MAGVHNDRWQADLGGHLVENKGLGRGTVDAGQIKDRGHAPGGSDLSKHEQPCLSNSALSSRATFRWW
jgi:hypothetical protein